MEKITEINESLFKIYTTISEQFIEEIVECIFYHINAKLSYVLSDIVNVFNPESNQKYFPQKC